MVTASYRAVSMYMQYTAEGVAEGDGGGGGGGGTVQVGVVFSLFFNSVWICGACPRERGGLVG